MGHIIRSTESSATAILASAVTHSSTFCWKHIIDETPQQDRLTTPWVCSDIQAATSWIFVRRPWCPARELIMIGEPLACAFNLPSISVLGVYVRTCVPPESLHELISTRLLNASLFLVKVLAEIVYVLLANTARYSS